MGGQIVTVNIKGLDTLQTKLEAMPEKLAKKGLRAALRAGAALFKSAMVSGAPKDTGFLAEHFGVKVKINRDGLAGTVYIGPQGKVDYPAFMSGAYKIKRRAGKIIKVGRVAVATVARFLEFGTAKMAKKPFMTQAYEGQKTNALNEVIDILWNAVQDAARD